MKILIAGLGSIGQRHLRNIRRVCGEDAKILAYRVRGLKRTFSDDMKIREGVDLEKEYDLKVYSDLDEALSEAPDICFVTNITSKHMETALKAVRAGCDVFLEKPVSDSLEDTEELLKEVNERGTVVYVGYQNRFHPCVQDVKAVLEEGRLGALLSVSGEFSERLITMHRYEDYRDTYMARKDMGGGPVLGLQIHALDYLQWLIGEPVSVYSVCGKAGNIDTDVEDLASSLYIFRLSDGREIPVYNHTDFLQFPPVHRFKLVFEKGRVEADLGGACTNIYEGDEPVRHISHEGFARNDMFITELKEFLECVKERRKPDASLEDGIKGLKMAAAAKLSAEEKRIVRIDEL
ncbi:MAG: Gfo/Idh/MocA family oxidoreductase [Lachnospiraceae bacterium]|nr:Gfo/Idh/MocA family oxidoreductase [Lachnospiraceae bacterium]